MLPSPTPPDAHAVRIALHHGPRHELWPLFELADDSALAIRRYLDLGLVHVASIGGVAIGHAQIVPHDVRVWELRSLAVLAPYRERGVGTGLVRRNPSPGSASTARYSSSSRRRAPTSRTSASTSASASAMLRIERDAFTAEGGYPAGLSFGGVPVRDRVWMEMPL